MDNFRFMHGIMLITFLAFCTMQARGLQAETKQICRSEWSRQKYRNKKEARPRAYNKRARGRALNTGRI